MIFYQIKHFIYSNRYNQSIWSQYAANMLSSNQAFDRQALKYEWFYSFPLNPKCIFYFHSLDTKAASHSDIQMFHSNNYIFYNEHLTISFWTTSMKYE